MIKLNFLLSNNLEIDQEWIERKDYRLEIFLEGVITIYVDNEQWFFDEYFNLIELGVSLNAWNRRNNYIFKSIDHDEALLYFSNDRNNNWIISSPWQEFQADHAIERDILIRAIENFIEGLDKALINKFNLKLTDFKGFSK